MKVLIDNGHGENTPGKRSPDGSLREYLYAREIAQEVVARLRARGYDADRIVCETSDIPLAERVRRVNEVCGRLGAKNVLLVSIHCNAAGNGNWMNAEGWSCYTSVGQTKADELADCFYRVAEEKFVGRKIRRDLSDGDFDLEAGFYMLNRTKCPAVLTENFFMDNRRELAYILSAEGREAIVATHVEAIIKYIKGNE